MRVYVPDVVEQSAVVRALREARAAADLARPGGLHLSTITDDMIRHMYPKQYKNVFSDEQMTNYQEIGNVVEYLIGKAFAEVYGRYWISHPEPKTVNGVTCSPDGELYGTTGVEIKACWVSERNFLTLTDDNEIETASPKFESYALRCLGYMHSHQWRRMM